MKYYLDTSVWLDFYEKRGKNGRSALRLIRKIIEEESVIVYSDLHIKELKFLGYSFDEINKLLSIAKPDNLRHAHISREQKQESISIAKERNIPKGDALHAILARDNNAVMISRDCHFEKLKDIVLTKSPEEA